VNFTVSAIAGTLAAATTTVTAAIAVLRMTIPPGRLDRPAAIVAKIASARKRGNACAGCRQENPDATPGVSRAPHRDL
jgi:hypothetical protein